jgi:diaminohydroxyphosphoribosylaminopyrimidine deaminase/5-amino-6-(5-phosphoribosylamino)uracil reductase
MKANYSEKDIHYMQEALRLAEQGEYTARPNPCVGAILVRDGKVVGEGYHAYYGGDHAEVVALKQAGELAKGATCYVTLEPCAHHGKTAPCVDALIAAGVKHVIVASQDPNPQVDGQGIKKLQDSGISVAQGLLNLQAKNCNAAFYHRMQKQSPYVVMKSAMSLDARTAMQDGTSKWITGEAARALVQKLRAKADAIVTGVETVLADDPELTVRSQAIVAKAHFRQPKRVILDSRLRTPLQAKILRTAAESIIATTCQDAEKIKAFEQLGVTVWQMPGEKINLPELLQRLVQMECQHVFVEAGSTLSAAFWQAGLVNEWHVLLAPKLLGDKAKPVLTMDVPSLEEAPELTLRSKSMLDEDLYLIFTPKNMQEKD